MRNSHRAELAGLAVAALVLAACGEGDDQQDDAQVRIDELESELEETREAAEDLLEENERLQDEIRELTADPDDEPDEPTEEQEEPAEDPDEQAVGEPQPIRSAEGLNEQLRTLFPSDGGPDGAWQPGTTDWSSAEVPDGLADTYDTPGELAFDLAALLEASALGMDSWETTTRVLMDDDTDLAYVAVLSWGYADDAVAGADWRMTITRSDDGWSPGGAESRFHCRRGVTDDNLCV